MKSLIIIFILNFVSLALRAEGVSFATTSFWQAPYTSTLSVKATNIDQGLVSSCDDFRKIATFKDGSLLPKGSYDLKRRVPDNTMENDFFAYFELQTIKGLETTVEIPDTSKIPFFKQNTSLMNLETVSVDGIKVKFNQNSLSAITEKLGLAPLEITVVNFNGKQLIKVYGRDTACDILSGEAKLQTRAQGLVYLPVEVQRVMGAFYDQVDTQVSKILSSGENQIIKTARLTFRLSEMLSPSTQSYSKDQEERVLALFKFLFQENSLNLSKSWVQGMGRPVLNAYGVSARVPLQLEITK